MGGERRKSKGQIEGDLAFCDELMDAGMCCMSFLVDLQFVLKRDPILPFDYIFQPGVSTGF